MTDNIPSDVQDAMLFAVNNFDEAFAVTAYGTPRDYSVDTKEFWTALAIWGPLALTGSFSMVTNTTTGEIAISYHP